MNKPLLITLLVCLAGALACRQDDPARQVAAASPLSAADPASVAPAQTPPPVPQGQPQPKLPTLKLWIGTNTVTAELARTHRQIQTGMMWRTNMAEMDGMLFVFPQPQQVAFYMRNTPLPLTCAYIDPEGTILEIYDMKPLDETTLASHSDQIQYVLEMNQGWFQRHGIRPGMVLSTDHGTFPQTFHRR